MFITFLISLFVFKLPMYQNLFRSSNFHDFSFFWIIVILNIKGYFSIQKLKVALIKSMKRQWFLYTVHCKPALKLAQVLIIAAFWDAMMHARITINPSLVKHDNCTGTLKGPIYSWFKYLSSTYVVEAHIVCCKNLGVYELKGIMITGVSRFIPSHNISSLSLLYTKF